MSQQPPYPHAGPAAGGDDAPTVTLRPSATYGPPPLTGSARPTGAPGGVNTMAVLSVVFAFVFSPLGIVFGIVGRGQTRRTGQPGRGLATTGLALSVVFLVLGVAAVVVVTGLVAQIAPSLSTGDQPAISEPAVPSDAVPPDAVPSEGQGDAVPSDEVPTGPAGTATVGVTDGEYGPEIPADALAEQVAAQSGATDVICPGYLPAQLDASTVCSGTIDGAQAQLETRVTDVQATEATVDIARVG